LIEAVVMGCPVPLGPPKRRLLLALLALECGRPVSVDRLVDLVWADPPRAARRVVFAHIARLRAALAGAAAYGVELVSAPSGYLLRVDPSRVDAHRFERQVAASAGVADRAARSRLLREALELWRGSALEGLAEGSGAQSLAQGLEILRLSALETRIAADLDAGLHGVLVGELTQLVAEHPLRERMVGQLMLALYRCGDISGALEVYRRARGDLATQLGVDPGDELTALHTALLRRDPSLAAAPPALVSAHWDPGTAASADDPSQTDDPPQSGAPDPVPRQLPAAIRHFAGRSDQLKVLHDLLDHEATIGGALAVVAISGTAGVGKTALAVHFSHRAAHRFPDGQLYVNLRGFDASSSPVHPAAAARIFLDALGVPPARVPADSEACLAMYRSRLADTRTLIVLDNARDAEQVRPLLPGAPRCLVLVTSRDRLPGLVALDGALPLALDLLATDEARELLALRLGAERVATQRRAADELIDLCARLPLALNIAAARAIVQSDVQLAVLAARLRDARRRLDLLSTGESVADLRAVFSWSYQALETQAARLFRLLSLHPGPDIAVAAAAGLAALPRERACAALDALTRAHLISEHAPGRYAFHDLLRAYSTEQTRCDDPDDQRREAAHRMLDYYLHCAHHAARILDPHANPVGLERPRPGVILEPAMDRETALGWFAAERAVLPAVSARAAETGFPAEAWRLAWSFTDFFDRQGYWHDLAAAHGIALNAALQLGDRKGQAHAHRGIARADVRLGRYDIAHDHLKLALDLHGALADHEGQAGAHRSLAWLYERQGRYDEALAHARYAFDHSGAAGDRIQHARDLNAVGWLHALLGDHDAALARCDKALAQHRELGDDYGEAGTLDSLGYLNHHVGRHDRAAACYTQAIALCRDLGDRYNEADILSRLGDTWLAADNPGAARDAWRQALEILRDLGHCDTAKVRRKLRETGYDPPRGRAAIGDEKPYDGVDAPTTTHRYPMRTSPRSSSSR
jgi:DNA-binding SARP family transcriptional activator/tetratricopeptide (TPR) repeat protein